MKKRLCAVLVLLMLTVWLPAGMMAQAENGETVTLTFYHDHTHSADRSTVITVGADQPDALADALQSSGSRLPTVTGGKSITAWGWNLNRQDPYFADGLLRLSFDRDIAFTPITDAVPAFVHMSMTTYPYAHRNLSASFLQIGRRMGLDLIDRISPVAGNVFQTLADPGEVSCEWLNLPANAHTILQASGQVLYLHVMPQDIGRTFTCRVRSHGKTMLYQYEILESAIMLEGKQEFTGVYVGNGTPDEPAVIRWQKGQAYEIEANPGETIRLTSHLIPNMAYLEKNGYTFESIDYNWSTRGVDDALSNEKSYQHTVSLSDYAADGELHPNFVMYARVNYRDQNGQLHSDSNMGAECWIVPRKPVPQTGDSFPIAALLCVLMLSAAAAAVVLRKIQARG